MDYKDLGQIAAGNGQRIVCYERALPTATTNNSNSTATVIVDSITTNYEVDGVTEICKYYVVVRDSYGTIIRSFYSVVKIRIYDMDGYITITKL